MRYALISDVHSNIEALTAVLKDIESLKPDKLLFLGDAVGYGPNPNECIEKLISETDLFLGGNHDWAAVDKTPADYFNPFAREAMDWTVEVLTDKNRDALANTSAEAVVDNIHLAHSTPLNPEDWRYIMTGREAFDNYFAIKTNICFIGHSHQPLVIEYAHESDFDVIRNIDITADPDKKYIVNIGSVGQPRDANPDSCWVLYDSDDGSIAFRRVSYDVFSTQKLMEEIGLPQYLIDRLSLGR